VVCLLIVLIGLFKVKGDVVIESLLLSHVEIFHFSYLSDPESDNFQNLISCSLSTDPRDLHGPTFFGPAQIVLVWARPTHCHSG